MRRRIPITIVDDTIDKPPSASVTSSIPEKIEPSARPAPIKRVEIQPKQAPKEVSYTASFVSFSLIVKTRNTHHRLPKRRSRRQNGAETT